MFINRSFFLFSPDFICFWWLLWRVIRCFWVGWCIWGVFGLILWIFLWLGLEYICNFGIFDNYLFNFPHIFYPFLTFLKFLSPLGLLFIFNLTQRIRNIQKRTQQKQNNKTSGRSTNFIINIIEKFPLKCIMCISC